MDPQACFSRIMELAGERPTEHTTMEFCDCFESLYGWLVSGGFAPRVESLGRSTVKTIDGTEERPRKWLGTPERKFRKSFAIFNSDDAFVFVAYDPKGNELQRWALV